MIELKPEEMCEWNGFDVYDGETGERMCPSEIAKREIPQEKRLPQIVDGFCLTWEGSLFLTCETGETAYVPSRGKYLVQINGERYMRW